VLDLGRRQAEIAVRLFRSRQENLVLRRARDHPRLLRLPRVPRAPAVRGPAELREHRILSALLDPDALETRWLKRLGLSVQPSLAILPR
jgi:hypothetical protein